VDLGVKREIPRLRLLWQRIDVKGQGVMGVIKGLGGKSHVCVRKGMEAKTSVRKAAGSALEMLIVDARSRERITYGCIGHRLLNRPPHFACCLGVSAARLPGVGGEIPK